MKKSELLKLPAMKATKEMYEKAWLEEEYDRYQRPSVTGPKYRKFYRARKTQGILEVDVFYYRDLRLKTSRPAFRIFLHDGKYDTYETIERKWRTATIENLQFGVSYNDGESAAYQTYWITEKDRKIIKDFTKNGEESPHSAILGWQQYEKHRKETDRIDDEMEIIPEIPKDFEEWAKKDAVPQYMYYESGKKIGRCTCCGKTQELSGHKYGQEGKCKYCKRKVIYKTYKKNPNIKDKSSAALIQKTPAGFVFRYLNVYQWICAGERTKFRYIRENTTRKWNNGDRQTVTDYHDYLQMAAILGYNMDDPYVLYPKNLKERHDQLVQEQEEREIELQGKKDDQKDGTLREMIKRSGWKAYEMETDDLLMRLPKRVREIRQEGQNQHHCVATYIDRMVSGETCILFIRKKEEPEESYYTVEVREGEVIQVRGKYNKDPGEDVKKFMNTFKKRIQMRKAG